MKKILKNALALTLITVVLGVVLALVHEVTLAPIAQQEQKTKEAAYIQVFPEASSFEEVDISSYEGVITAAIADAGFDAEKVNGIVLAKDEAGETVGLVFDSTTSEGYGGDIRFALGIDLEGTIHGISFLSISETAGLGMKANTDEFKNQFVDKNCEKIVYTKSGATAPDEIDALSGATITTNAVTNGVNATLAAFRALMEGGIAG